MGLYIIHFMRRSRCFVFDNLFEVAKFLWRQNQSVQLRLIPYMYVCPTSAHWGFRHGYRRYKDNTFILETTLFSWKSMVSISDLTLLYINTSKNSTFAWFFSLKSSHYQWLFVSFQHENPPSLSTMLKCAGRFCFYNSSMSKYVALVYLLSSFLSESIR